MKKIQSAFQQAMDIIAKDLKLKTEDLNVWIKHVGGEIRLFARNEEKVLTAVDTQKLIGTKMIGLRMTKDRLNDFFQRVYTACINCERPTEPDTVSLVLYASRLAREICVGVYVGNKAHKAYKIADLMEMVGIGSEELN